MRTEPEHIVTMQLRHVAETFSPGDGINTKTYIANGTMDERLVKTLESTGHIVPLTRENYARCITHRPAGTVGKGFTRAYLEAKGIIDPEAKEPPAPAATKAGKPAKSAKAPPAERGRIEITPDAERIGAFFLVPRKVGNFVFLDLTNEQGDLVRNSGFRNRDKAIAFIESLKDGAASGNAGPSEKADGSDVRPGA